MKIVVDSKTLLEAVLFVKECLPNKPKDYNITRLANKLSDNQDHLFCVMLYGNTIADLPIVDVCARGNESNASMEVVPESLSDGSAIVDGDRLAEILSSMSGKITLETVETALSIKQPGHRFSIQMLEDCIYQAPITVSNKTSITVNKEEFENALRMVMFASSRDRGFSATGLSNILLSINHRRLTAVGSDGIYASIVDVDISTREGATNLDCLIGPKSLQHLLKMPGKRMAITACDSSIEFTSGISSIRAILSQDKYFDYNSLTRNKPNTDIEFDSNELSRVLRGAKIFGGEYQRVVISIANGEAGFVAEDVDVGCFTDVLPIKCADSSLNITFGMNISRLRDLVDITASAGPKTILSVSNPKLLMTVRSKDLPNWNSYIMPMGI